MDCCCNKATLFACSSSLKCVLMANNCQKLMITGVDCNLRYRVSGSFTCHAGQFDVLSIVACAVCCELCDLVHDLPCMCIWVPGASWNTTVNRGVKLRTDVVDCFAGFPPHNWGVLTPCPRPAVMEIVRKINCVLIC